jgi:hypothetical protein
MARLNIPVSEAEAGYLMSVLTEWDRRYPIERGTIALDLVLRIADIVAQEEMRREREGY